MFVSRLPSSRGVATGVSAIQQCITRRTLYAAAASVPTKLDKKQ
jgi:hypothetical protein